MQPENARMLVDISSLDEARRVEETIKTGYIDVIIENIVNWIGIEEDLAASYEKLSKSLARSDQRELANELQVLSDSDVSVLRRWLEEFEGLENEYKKRIRLVKKLMKSV
jgi:hypothetical protein